MNTLPILLSLCFLYAQALSPERVFQLKDGSVIRGEIVDVTGPSIRIHSKSLGEMSIARDQVESLDGRADFALRAPRKEDEDRIAPDGTIESRLTWIDRNTSDRPLKTYRLLAEGVLKRVTDPLGLPLAVAKEIQEGICRCTVSLGTPVPAGETFMLVLETVRAKAIEVRDGKYTWETTVVADQSVSYERVVVLPTGAVIEKASPEPAEATDGKIVWRGTLSAGESFKPSVIYRLS